MGKWVPESPNSGVWNFMFISTFVILCSELCFCQDFGPPPIVWVDRHWTIPEDEPVGSRVAQARAADPDPNLVFSLEPTWNMDGSAFFRIDPKTGVVYLNESMQGKSGKEYYVSLQARSGGGIPIKTEIYIQITPSISNGSPKRIAGSAVVPKKPTVPVVNGGSPVGHDGRPVSNVPALPPNFTVPPNAVTPPPPPPDPEDPPLSSFERPLTSNDPPLSTESAKPTLPDKVDNALPSFPPAGPNSNKNVYHIEDEGQLKVDDPPKVTDPHVTSNDLEGAGPFKQILPATGSNATFGPAEPSKNDSTNYIVVFTIVPIVLVFGVVPIVVASIWLVRRRTRVKKRPTKEMRKESAATSNSSMTMSGEAISPTALRQWIKQAQSNRYESWNLGAGGDAEIAGNRWEFPRHHLQVGRILGEGCFGQVWQCEALNIDGKEGVTIVAVKTLKEGAGDREKGDLLSELAVMKMLDPHPHVVRLLGACTEKEPLFLIMEYVALGKLQSFLRNSRSTHYYPNLHADSSSLSSKDLTAFCYQIARGMEYLASKGIIHRDLAARNILIDKDRICKVADFGFARDVVANHVYERKTDGRLPVRWMAPEALYDNIFTTKTDIWSFGVLMWEIVTLGSTPYPGISAAEVMRKVREGYRLEKPDHCRRELYNIMFYCWAANPDDRPTFTDLVNFLKHLLFSETDYIQLDKFPDHDYYNYMSNQTSGEKL